MDLSELRDGLELRANSLIVSVFGDTLLPLGGGTWLSGLIALMADFGLSERLVRTGVYRLQKDGVLESRTEGRRAFYSLSDFGRATFETAERRIYQLHRNDWKGDWQLVYLLPGLTTKERHRIKKELHWQSFRELGPSLLARPSDLEFDRGFLKQIPVYAENLMSFVGNLDDSFSEKALAELVSDSWSLDLLQADYETHISRFDVGDEELRTLASNQQEAFVLKTLLIHDYRRLLLRDPQLPDDLLPPNWAGKRAALLVTKLYKKIAKSGQKYAVDCLNQEGASDLKISDDFWNRFGGLG